MNGHSNWARNKERAKYRNTDASLTEQSQARETDINVIVGRMGVSGTVPGTTKTPMGGDFTNLPVDLREMIETSRTMKQARQNLPPELRDIPVDELLNMTATDIVARLTPPKPAKQEGET